MQSRPAIWLFAILVRLPKKSVKIKLRRKIKAEAVSGKQSIQIQKLDSCSVLSLSLNGSGHSTVF